MNHLTNLSLILLSASFIASCGSKKKQYEATAPNNKPRQVNSQSNIQLPTRVISTASGMQMQIISERADTINPKLIYTFQGKGTAVTWDIGVAKAAYERMNLLRQDKNPQSANAGDVIVTGNSSGSILAAWFSCRGITAESIKGAESLMSSFPSNLVNESTNGKILEIFNAMRSGQEFGGPINPMIPLADSVTNNGTCVPKLPTVIVASNQDVDDNRVWIPGKDQNPRVFDPSDYSYWQRTAATNFVPQKIGKICTYFADPVMFKYLSDNMPKEERLCDLRVMETAEDVRLAVLASIAEPTYFVPVPEINPAKLSRLTAQTGQPANRVYNGGFSMPGVVQDMKRIFPNALAMGTGRWLYTSTEVTVMQAWYNINLNTLQEHSRWWFDMETFPNDAEKTALTQRPANLQGAALTSRYQQEITMGYQRAQNCFHKGIPCIPGRAIVNGVDVNRPILTSPVGQQNTPVRTRQGLDAILD